MSNRKGLSPLIATVLLIAFAVALGAMIMNWSTGVQTPVPPVGGSAGAECQKTSIELSEAFGQPIFCYAEGNIRFNIQNNGDKKIAGIQLHTVDEDLNPVKRELPNSAIAIGDTLNKELPFDKSGKVHVELVPFIKGGDGSNIYCPQKRIVQDVLPDCSN